MRPPPRRRGGATDGEQTEHTRDDAGHHRIAGDAVTHSHGQHRRRDHGQDGQRGVRRGGGGDRFEQFLTHPGQAGGQRLVLRLKRVALDRGHQHQRGAVFDAEFVESFGDVESHAVGFVQFVADTGFESGQASSFQFIVEQLDDVVDENLDRHRRRVHLRDKVFATYHRNCATRRECDLRHYRGLSASGTYLSANAAVISNSRSRVFFCNSWRVSIMPPLAKCGSNGMNSTVAPDCPNRSVRYARASASYLLRLSFSITMLRDTNSW